MTSAPRILWRNGLDGSDLESAYSKQLCQTPVETEHTTKCPFFWIVVLNH